MTSRKINLDDAGKMRLNEIASAYEKGQAHARIMREAGIPEPRIIDYLGLLKPDMQMDLSIDLKELHEELRPLFERSSQGARDSMAKAFIPNYIPIVCGADRSYEIHPHQREATAAAISRMQRMPILVDMGKRRSEPDGNEVMLHWCWEDNSERLEKLLENIPFKPLHIDPMQHVPFYPDSAVHEDDKMQFVEYKTWGGEAAHFRPAYERMHALKKTHDQICKELLKPYKKRRKALRKQLDIIGSEYK